MRKRIMVLLMAVMMSVMSAAPALAGENPHHGCKAFGQYMSHVARAGKMGEKIRDYGSGVDSYPGKVSVYIYYQKQDSCSR